MPRWEVHLSFGLMAFVIILSAQMLGSGQGGSLNDLLGTMAFFGIMLLLGGGSLLLGSVLPDIDGRGRVRWMIGPAVGALLFLPPLIGSFGSGGAPEAMAFIRGAGSFIFLSGTALGYLLLAVPKKHRGIWHSNRTGLIFGAAWGAYVFYTASVALDQSLMIGSMGAVGYGWHLALDGKLI
ncbi:MAG: hypothetical protein JXA22_08175 [Candidatus Thermoplasmatota archaeon]|nr:hypothetical protein [Candidatus Thermoplasmatota archaeon]